MADQGHLTRHAGKPQQQLAKMQQIPALTSTAIGTRQDRGRGGSPLVSGRFVCCLFSQKITFAEICAAGVRGFTDLLIY